MRTSQLRLSGPPRFSGPPSTVISVVGARPNFMKLAPVARELAQRHEVRHVIVHTGQHYDRSMSGDFFDELDIPEPDVNLNVGSGSHAAQTAAVLQSFESYIVDDRPDVVLVYGDVNSTVAAALACAKLGIPVGHVEAGLRSFDWGMPEEINRVLTDRLSSLLFIPSRDAVVNLEAEGSDRGSIEFVGNVMIDTLVRALPRLDSAPALDEFGVEPERYVLATLHRPSNVEDPKTLGSLIQALGDLGRDHVVLLPAHPRTRGRLEALANDATTAPGSIRVIDPVPYLTMLSLISNARLVVTDSGGVQEETSYLGVPCITVRPNTERPITCTEGTNELLDPDSPTLARRFRERAETAVRSECTIERWDGRTAERIVQVLCDGRHHAV